MLRRNRGTRVLVTGGAGFIGSSIVRRLADRGCEVIVVIRPGTDPGRLEDISSELDLLRADVFDGPAMSEVLRAAGPHILIHGAWHAEPGTYLTHPGNIDDLTGSLDLIERARRVGCKRIVGLGTCLEYDTSPGLLTESGPLKPASVYAASKTALYIAAEAWARQYGVDFAWARIFYPYGPGEDGRRLVPSVITALLGQRRVAVTGGKQVRDYLHVSDIADAIVEVALGPVQGAINIGSGHPITVRDLVSKLADYLGRWDLVEFGARPDTPGDPPFICADVARLRDEVGWLPGLRIEEGLAQTIAWWRQRQTLPMCAQ